MRLPQADIFFQEGTKEHSIPIEITLKGTLSRNFWHTPQKLQGTIQVHDMIWKMPHPIKLQPKQEVFCLVLYTQADGRTSGDAIFPTYYTEHMVSKNADWTAWFITFDKTFSYFYLNSQSSDIDQNNFYIVAPASDMEDAQQLRYTMSLGVDPKRAPTLP